MAYAAVISLIHTIERLINPTNPEIAESAYEELQSLRDAIWKLEDVLESYVLSVPASQGLGDENGVEQEIDSILKTVKKLRIRYSSNLDDPVPRKLEDEVVWRLHDFLEKKTPTVGSSDQIGKIVHELLDGKLGLKTVSLVGMAGIGKTHLAMTELKSLVLVCRHSSSFSIKSCKLHSAYWHLCVKEARKNKFFHVLNKLTDASKHNVENPRRLSVQNPILFGIKEVVASLMSPSLLCTGLYHEYPVPICFDFMLLKLLDALAIRFYDFPTEVVNLKQLRYLALTHNGIVPCSISNLKQLQCLIVRPHHNIKLLRDSTRLPHGICDVQEVSISKWLRDSTCLPKEIWDVQELRHLRIMGGNLPDPSDGTKLPNLSTLHVNAHSCTKAVFSSVPNVKKIGIEVELQPDAAETLSCFEHIHLALELIQSLKCVVVNPRTLVAPSIDPLKLPKHLKKLSLNGLGYPWMYMSEIGYILKCSSCDALPFRDQNGKQMKENSRDSDFCYLKILTWCDGKLKANASDVSSA